MKESNNSRYRLTRGARLQTKRQPIEHKKVAPSFDWVPFWIRVTCGAIFGAMVGFGVWARLCWPRELVGVNAVGPRLLDLLGLTNVIDSGTAGVVCILLFAMLFGLIGAVWNHLRWWVRIG